MKLTSLPSFIIKREPLCIPTGFANGYVLLPPSHKYFNTDYDDISVDVHGGLTFSQIIDEHLLKMWNIPNEYFGWYCVGFDTAHYNDSLTNWSEQAVINETLRLMQQLL